MHFKYQLTYAKTHLDMSPSQVGQLSFLAFTEQEMSSSHSVMMHCGWEVKKGKGSPYSITKCRVPELILVLGSQPVGDVSHKPSDKLPLLSARNAVTLARLLPISLLGKQMHDGCEKFA